MSAGHALLGFTALQGARSAGLSWRGRVQVSFIMNNLTASNLAAKVPELRGLLPAEHWPWFCNYLVVRRAAQVCLRACTAGRAPLSGPRRCQQCPAGCHLA